MSSGSGSHKILSAEFVPSDEDASSEDKVPSDDEEEDSEQLQGNQARPSLHTVFHIIPK